MPPVFISLRFSKHININYNFMSYNNFIRWTGHELVNYEYKAQRYYD